MSYENKEYILQFFEGVHEKENRDELLEVYRKAEAFDAIVGKYEGIMKDVRNRKFKVTSDVTLLGLEAEKVIKKYEIGEPNVKK